jgi:hypothetical protein
MTVSSRVDSHRDRNKPMKLSIDHTDEIEKAFIMHCREGFDVRVEELEDTESGYVE